LPARDGFCRLAPIAFLPAPTPAKPSRKASPEQQAQYRQQARASRLGVRAAEQITELRYALDREESGKDRPLLMAFDGGYTNSTVLKKLPPHTTGIGRIRKDAKLYFEPEPHNTRGRRRCYGAPAPTPTPEEVRTKESEPWQILLFTQGGVTHKLRYKRCQHLMWRTAGANQLLQLIVIAPLSYRLRKGSKLLYRDPAYLICTDTTLSVQQILEAYFQRWGIEVNFRDEKTLLGVGQEQVRTLGSVASAPALTVAAYALLLVSAQRAFGNSDAGLLPPPKWLANSTPPRISTQRLLHQLRAEVWGRGLSLHNFSDFASKLPSHTKPTKYTFPLASAVCYANA
jgi:hypothetical protein